LGDYYGTVDVALFKQKDLNPGLIRAVPMRVTGMSEVDNNRMDGATIKRLTGNDMVAAEAKGSNVIFEGRPQFTTLIACNSEPDITGADEALRERVLILPFETTIPRAERNYTRQAEIERQSGEAVLAWLVEGWKMYCREGLKRSAWPARIKRLSGEVVNHFNAVQTFIVEHVEKYTECEDGQKAWELAKRNAKRAARGIPNATDWPLGWQLNSAEIFSIYTNWCSDSNVHAVSKIEFSKALGMGRTFQKKVDGVRKDMYLGARMRRDEDG
jgi:phage/plasmid-associated DNA primase